jgi:hypothetical protein
MSQLDEGFKRFFGFPGLFAGKEGNDRSLGCANPTMRFKHGPASTMYGKNSLLYISIPTLSKNQV